MDPERIEIVERIERVERFERLVRLEGRARREPVSRAGDQGVIIEGGVREVGAIDVPRGLVLNGVWVPLAG